MSHKVAIRDGKSAVDEKDLTNFAVAFLSATGGVVGSGDYLVEAQSSPNNTIKVATGRAYVPNSAGTMMYATFLDASQNVTITGNSSGNPRIDSIVLYIDLAASPTSTGDNVPKFYDVQGTPAGSPTAPDSSAILSAIGASNPYIVLANIAVTNGFTSISSGNITDARIIAAISKGLPIDTDITLAANSDTEIPSQKAVKTYVDNSLSGASGMYLQGIINAGCEVAQRVTAPNISSSYQYGAVDRFAAKGGGTAVSAGTIAQTSSANCGTTGFALKLAGVTLTGTGIAYIRYRIESADAKNFKNLAASFACKVYHDVGSAKNYTIYIRKPTVTDDFSSTTDIANSGAIPVNSGTATTINFNNINSGNLGDVSKGIEIEIQVACGAITTKNFEFTEFVFALGATAPDFVAKSFGDELSACKRYWDKSYDYAVAPGDTSSNGAIQYNTGTSTSNRLRYYTNFTVPKRASGTATVYDAAGNVGKITYLGTSDGQTNNNSPLGNSFHNTGLLVIAQPTSQSGLYFHWVADAEL